MRAETIARMRDELVGRRVRLAFCADPWSPPPAGTLGTVTSVDDVGTVHVAWDNGSRLGLIPGIDRWDVINKENADAEQG